MMRLLCTSFEECQLSLLLALLTSLLRLGVVARVMVPSMGKKDYLIIYYT